MPILPSKIFPFFTLSCVLYAFLLPFASLIPPHVLLSLLSAPSLSAMFIHSWSHSFMFPPYSLLVSPYHNLLCTCDEGEVSRSMDAGPSLSL